MDPRRFVIGTLAGGVAVFATGTLLFSIAPVRDFLAYAMNAGSATGVAREPQLVWAVALGALAYSALITFAIGCRADSVNTRSGIKIGRARAWRSRWRGHRGRPQKDCEHGRREGHVGLTLRSWPAASARASDLLWGLIRKTTIVYPEAEKRMLMVPVISRDTVGVGVSRRW